MNAISSISNRPVGKRLTLGILSLFTAATVAASAADAQKVSVSLGGKQFGHAKALNATSTTYTIAKSKLYNYTITGTIKGKDGQLGAAFPNGVALDDFFDSIKAGSSSFLKGSLDNPAGTLPATLFSRSIKGSRNIDGLGRVSLELNFVAKISATGQIALAITKVKILSNGAPVTGTMVFGKGSKLVASTAPIVEFKATGQLPVAETAGTAKVIIWRQGNKNVDASVSYTTADGTARAGTDYAATSGTVVFKAGDFAEKTIEIPLIVSPQKKGYRSFKINLSQPGTGTTLGSKSSTTVNIKADT